ncbi:MAG: DUF4013 domain-containing protein [Chloroflexi bacterium]|nr:DUF4013 domain-containing protein [Chloroflexota bacterium]
MQDIGKAFTYMFEDENWITKILLGGVFVLLSFILVGIPFIIGFMIVTIQNVLAGRPKPLAEWDNLGDKFVKGLLLGIALIIWYIPSFVISMIGSFLPAIAGPKDGGPLVLLGLLFSCVAFIYNIALAFILPAIFLQYAVNPNIGSAFQFNEIFSMVTRNVGNFVIVFLLSLVASIIASFGFIALCVGVLFTLFWAELVQAYLYGQLGVAGGKGTPSAII